MLDINWFSFFKTVFPKIKKENSWSGCLVGYFLILVFFLKTTKKYLLTLKTFKLLSFWLLKFQ